MKRVVSTMILALVFCLGASAVSAQPMTPGPPMAAMPQNGVPMPVMGQPGPMPGFDPSFCPPPGPPPCPPPMCGPGPAPCGPMPCGPMMPCGPSRKSSLGALVGWQVSNDIGGMKFSARNSPIFFMCGQKLDFKLDGIWLGGSGRMELADGLTARVEYRHLFPSKAQVDTTTALREGGPGHRNFTKANYQWNVLDSSAAICVSQGMSALAGFRWDSFYVLMTHGGTVNLYSSPADEGDLLINCYQPYAGGELSITNCDSGVLLRIIGSPWMPVNVKYGMTFGPGQEQLPWIRDRMVVNSKWGAFFEASLLYGKKVMDGVTLGGFAMFNSINACFEGDLTSYRGVPTAELSQKFDVSLNRVTLTIGGNVAVAIKSPL